MISNYTPDRKYSLPMLMDVLLLPASQTISVSVDNGSAYFSGVTPSSLVRMEADTITLNTNDSLSDRYQYITSIVFNVDGKAEITDGDYYIITEAVDGTCFLLNYGFPATVEYTYTLSNGQDSTEVTLTALSNYPHLQVKGLDPEKATACKKYKYTATGRLLINESDFTAANGSNIQYTNDGFKEVVYNRDSLSLTEHYKDGQTETALVFNIPFSDYKSSWHYNLEEFTENRYCAIVQFDGGNYAKAGFGNGMEAHYSIYGTSVDGDVDYIEISLSNVSEKTIEILSGTTMTPLTATEWAYTTKYNGWQCVGKDTAQYLLQERQDAFGNPTGVFRCYTGWTSYFTEQGIEIEEEFDDYETFRSSFCAEQECIMNTSMPDSLILTTSTTGIPYTFYSDTDITLSASTPSIRFDGQASKTIEGGTTATVSVSSSIVPSSTPAVYYIYIKACDTEKTVSVTVRKPSCIEDTTTSAKGKRITINSSCPIKNVSTVSDFISFLTWMSSTDSGSITFSISDNPPSFDGSAVTATNRTAVLSVEFLGGSTQTVRITQSAPLYQWISEGYVCSSGKACDRQRLYWGNSSATTTTGYIRQAGCVPSTGCSGSITRWIEDGYACLDGGKYVLEKEEVSYDGGISWEATGNQRTGRQIGDADGECSSIARISTTANTSFTLDCSDGLLSSTTTDNRAITGLITYPCCETIDSGVVSGATNLTITTFNEGLIEVGDEAFRGCSSLIELTLPSTCTYIGHSAFSGCTSLQRITLNSEVKATLFSDSLPNGITLRVPCHLLPEYRNQWDGRPWTFESIDGGCLADTPLTFSSNANGSRVRMVSETFIQMEYSSDGTDWYQYGGEWIPIEAGDTVSFKAQDTDWLAYNANFETQGDISVYGNIMSLVDNGSFGSIIEVPMEGCFAGLFSGSTGITDAESLLMPATVLTEECYKEMFRGCSNLGKTPLLPAIDIYGADGAYAGMYKNCNVLYSIKCAAVNDGSTGTFTEWVQGVSQIGVFQRHEDSFWNFGDDGIPIGWTVDTL